MRVGRILAAGSIGVLLLGGALRLLADCAALGLPFTDLDSESTFCAAIAEAYYTGITGGTSATTFSPNDPLTRSQGAAFATRTLDAALTRGSRPAALGQWWTTMPHYDAGLGLTTVGTFAQFVKSDGADIWVANNGGTVSRVRASDGRPLGTWTDAVGASGVVVAMGRIFVAGQTAISGSTLYVIDPTSSAGSVGTVTTGLGPFTQEVAFDGDKIWTANDGGGSGGSVSIVTPGSSTPWNVTTVSTGFTQPTGILFDGSHIWVTDNGAGTLMKLDPGGGITQTIPVGAHPHYPGFDGRNIWVPNTGSDSLTVVRAADGAIIKTFSAANGDANGLSQPLEAAFARDQGRRYERYRRIVGFRCQ